MLKIKIDIKSLLSLLKLTLLNMAARETSDLVSSITGDKETQKLLNVQGLQAHSIT